MRSQQQFYNAIIGGIRKAYRMFNPKFQIILDKARVELPRYNKDGSLSKRNEVRYKCNNCNGLFKSSEVNVDHVIPVIESGKSQHDYTWDEYIDRMDCSISNLQVLCKVCHKVKTKRERKK